MEVILLPTLTLTFLYLVFSPLSSLASIPPSREQIMQKNCEYAKGLYPNLIRFITKEGYHREIEDYVEVTFTNSVLSPSDFEFDCRLALLAKFTQDLYIDAYEIQNIPSLAKTVKVLNNWTDLEGPEWMAKSNSTVFIELKANATGNLLSTSILKLPIHFRYQKPLSHSRFKERLRQSMPGSLVNPAGYAKVVLPLPRLLLRCDSWTGFLSEKKCHAVKAICNPGLEVGGNCEWVLLPFTSNSKQGSHVFLPVGDSDQVLIVTLITLLVVACGTVFILLVLVRAKDKLETIALVSSSNKVHLD